MYTHSRSYTGRSTDCKTLIIMKEESAAADDDDETQSARFLSMCVLNSQRGGQ